MKLILVAKDSTSENDLLKKELLEKYPESEFVFISPADDSYKIEEIRIFLNRLNKKQGDFTKNLFYILKSGDKLSAVCQNALLKTFEESNYSIGILVRNESSLLSTIKSRCQTTYLQSDIKKYSDVENITFEEITAISKQERSEVIKLLEQKIFSLSANPQKALIYQEAANKINANCKIESVLIELVEKIK